MEEEISKCINAYLSTGTASDLVIKDSTIDNCSGAGIQIGGTIAITAEIVNARVNFANNGMLIFNGWVSVSGSTFSSPQIQQTASTSGISTQWSTTGLQPWVTLDNCNVTGFGYGIFGYLGNIQVTRSTISYNYIGLGTNGSAAIVSSGNNTFSGNASNGAFTSTVSVF